jgi:hypothetical protein
MNRTTPTSFATLFAAGAFMVAGAVPALAATVVSPRAGTSLMDAGCGAKTAKGAKDAKCGKGGKCSKTKQEAAKKGAKDASCGKGSCGSSKKKG